ncbi:MAG: preprotein translocase subunit YajC [Clostridia bacterium]|nr:preprotein translocase subunit YajC [Clostridia bacterium]
MGAGTSGLLFYLLIFAAIFYFLIYRPQQKQKKQRMELMESLDVGKDIVTIGGIHGTITELGENDVTLKVSENVEIKAQKLAIGYVLNNDQEGPEGGSACSLKGKD